ncbi:uncharacterized protein TRAVEDRAFT_56410 [Trametes versicolor FP-101664 SS1]|uniref:uncharacterized protein n=1 Tax=Trametes versicolor (strain FP-101664) TaxID=717944 RepID=UPI0004622CAB|nr:uncharacterized protein TRAVEDRAFT_56410 [Trametes versicolor FP-101664 SS1]EIW63381.1 hypothetical protein TRAVEDRAFT_56410 [Trametes versicolor FP-101664 SS1]
MAHRLQRFEKRLGKAEIEAGLHALSDAIGTNIASLGLTQDALPIRAMVAGGALAVLKFNTRASTLDVDFALDASQGALEESLVRLAATDAVRRVNDGDLGHYWFNPAVRFYAHMPPYGATYAAALAQDEVVFAAEHLVLYAMPWRFQLFRKLARMSRDVRCGLEVRATDVQDAGNILWHLREKEGREVTFEEVCGWYADPGARMSKEAAGLVAESYRERFGGSFVV